MRQTIITLEGHHNFQADQLARAITRRFKVRCEAERGKPGEGTNLVIGASVGHLIASRLTDQMATFAQGFCAALDVELEGDYRTQEEGSAIVVTRKEDGKSIVFTFGELSPGTLVEKRAEAILKAARCPAHTWG